MNNIRTALYLSRWRRWCAHYPQQTTKGNEQSHARAIRWEKKRLGIAVRNWKPPSVKSHITFTVLRWWLLSFSFVTSLYTGWKGLQRVFAREFFLYLEFELNLSFSPFSTFEWRFRILLTAPTVDNWHWYHCNLIFQVFSFLFLQSCLLYNV